MSDEDGVHPDNDDSMRATAWREVLELGRLTLQHRADDELYETVTSTVADRLGTELCLLYERPAEADHLQVRAGLDVASLNATSLSTIPDIGGLEAGVDASVPAGRDSHAGYTFHTRDPVVVRDYGIETRFDRCALLDHLGGTSGACVPVGPRASPLGVLAVHEQRARNFTVQEVEYLELVANTLASAAQRTAARDHLSEHRDRVLRRSAELSHDLRNPLSVAQGNLRLVQEDCDDERLDAVEAAHERIGRLCESFQRLGNEEGELTDPKWVQLDDIAEEAWATVPTQGATLRAESELACRADPKQLRRVFENLFRNSVQHGSTNGRHAERGDGGPGHDSDVHHSRTTHHDEATLPTDGTLTVTIDRLSEGSGFHVEDDGSGMCPTVQDDATEFGYSTDKDGSGIGLGVVDRIARNHHWETSLSEGSDGGLRVAFTGVRCREAEATIGH